MVIQARNALNEDLQAESLVKDIQLREQRTQLEVSAHHYIGSYD